MSSKSSNSNATIAFTLPISCQICLGKVKEPVVCPNQHVFCSQCMELWLERNQQCPACRIYITEQNPCRKVLGGLNPETASTENFNQKQLRRARMELIYKDYENEIDRLEAELAATKQDNKELHNLIRVQESSKSNQDPTSSPSSSMTSEQDRTTISLLNNKLRDAAELYQKVKAELSTYKQENMDLKQQTAETQRQAQNLRLDLAGRSPRRFGRCTVATLEAKVESSEKQILKLQKALEHSDKYIEDIEKQLGENRSLGCKHCLAGNNRQNKVKFRKIDDESFDHSKTESTLNDSKLTCGISNISERSDMISDIKLDDSDIYPRSHRRKDDQSSMFNLDTPGSSHRSDKHLSDSDLLGKSGIAVTEDSFNLSQPSTSKLVAPTLDGCKKKLQFAFGDSADSSGEDLVQFTKPTKESKDLRTKLKVGFSEPPETGSMTDLNVSMTPDLEDCFRIMDEAKRKLEQRHLPTTTSNPNLTSTSHITTCDVRGRAELLPTDTGDNIPSATAVASILSSMNPHQTVPAGLHTSTNASVLYPRMQSLSESLRSRSEVTAASLHTRGPGSSQYTVQNHGIPGQSLTLPNMLSVHNNVTPVLTIPGVPPPVGVSGFPSHSQGGSTLSQPHHSQGGSTLSQPHVSLASSAGSIMMSGRSTSAAMSFPGFTQ